jgi:hypothetical protein
MRPLARIAAGCVVIAFGGILACSRDDSGQRPPQPDANGQTNLAPIRLLDLDGRPFDLWKQDSSSSTVVLFTRTDCPISNRCAPEIRSLHERYHERGVRFYLIYVDPREGPEEIGRHLREYGYPCPGLRDPQHTLVAFCGATATPEAVVFDKNHVITYRGRIDDLYVELGQPRSEPTTHDLADAIESTVLGQPVAVPRTNAVGCRIADVRD